MTFSVAILFEKAPAAVERRPKQRGSLVVRVVIDGRGQPPDGSENLLDDMHGPIRSDFASPDGEQTVQECVLRIGSFEAKPRAEVRRAWGSIVPDAVECRMNEHAILRPQREARVELEHAVRPFDCPIVAAGQDLATQTRAFEGTSDDRK